MIVPRLFKPRYPSLDWIQVEVSSHCPADCKYCPRHAYARNWKARHMPVSVFENLVPAFRKARLVYLQGWGEPFTHPDFFDMLRVAKSAGCRVGTTTSGTRIDEAMAARLVEYGIDIMAFSLAGTREVNDSIRGKNQFDAVRRATRFLHQAKNMRQQEKPAIHIAYMLLYSHMDDLNQMLDFFADIREDQVVVSSLSLVTRKEWIKEARLADSEAEWNDLIRRMQMTMEQASQKGVNLHVNLVSPFAPPRPCYENVGRALFVGSDGEVSPCVMTGIPAAKENYCDFNNNAILLPYLTFGNIQMRSLNEIWRQPAYREFRRLHATGRLPAICRQCLKSKSTVIQNPADGHPENLIPDILSWARQGI